MTLTQESPGPPWLYIKTSTSNLIKPLNKNTIYTRVRILGHTSCEWNTPRSGTAMLGKTQHPNKQTNTTTRNIYITTPHGKHTWRRQTHMHTCNNFMQQNKMQQLQCNDGPQRVPQKNLRYALQPQQRNAKMEHELQRNRPRRITKLRCNR